MDESTRSGSEYVRDDNSKGGGGKRSFQEFGVKIGLSPLLFIAKLDLISRKTVVKDAMKKTPICRRPGPSGEWQTGAIGDTEGVERFVYQTRAET